MAYGKSLELVKIKPKPSFITLDTKPNRKMKRSATKFSNRIKNQKGVFGKQGGN